ncbi:MAG: response regulator [Candidatus Omnitrophica bacterium]|nr:response regulator [Candidatus Omnitrophota bacterium]
MNILIADNIQDLAESLKEILLNKGHAVDTAFNGKQAMEYLQMKHYDMVFLDHDMPEVTGLEVLKHIRANKIASRVVMITGYPNVPDFFAKTLGADEFLSKPFTFEQILQIVEKYNPT